VGQHAGTTLEAILSGCISGFDEDEIELLAQMSAHAKRAVNWNVLNLEGIEGRTTDEGKRKEGLAHQLRPSVRAREIGGRVVALMMPAGAELNMSMATYCAMWLIPGWREIMTLPFAEKTAKLRDPQVRASMVAAAQGTGLEQFAHMARYRIGDTVAPQNKKYEDRLVSEIAAERGVDPWDALLDIEVADEYKTVLWPVPNEDGKDWGVRQELWAREDVLLGGSDAGAHLDRLLASPYPTRFIAQMVRKRQLISLERAVHLMTDKPARLYGLKDRGRLVEGAFADVVVFDQESIESGPARRAFDLPGGSLRLTASSVGIKAVLVNGTETILDGAATGNLPGTVLHSGRDTETVATSLWIPGSPGRSSMPTCTWRAQTPSAIHATPRAWAVTGGRRAATSAS
jgi:N-acyl-D-aspartate/D-glutamate deacylase